MNPFAWLMLLIPVIHALGMLASIHAILTSRTPEGAIAWGMALFTFPYLALPLYLVFGRDRFNGYVHALRVGTFEGKNERVLDILRRVHAHTHNPEPNEAAHVQVLQSLARIPFTGACSVELLIDGQETYARIHHEIDKARDYVLVLFFIVNDDGAGRALQGRLIEAARRGVRVYFVYDEMGSSAIQGDFVEELRAAGVEAHPFATTQGWRNRFQINFRNHRKIVVVDGKVALTGGMNIGDECLGLSSHYGPWRDTHVVVEGPAVMSVQLVFIEDYHWATGGQLPVVNWTPHCHPDANLAATYLSSGPADLSNVGIMFYLECITAARTRLWMETPYFVPDPAIMEALRIAALRGVDVRIMIPPGRYEKLMRAAALAYLPELKDSGIQIYEYRGYNHSKIMLVDDWLSWVGSSNLDNRSLRLNFEGNLVVLGDKFAHQVEAMLERDFAHSKLLDLAEFERYGLLTQLGTKVARLFIPIL